MEKLEQKIETLLGDNINSIKEYQGAWERSEAKYRTSLRNDRVMIYFEMDVREFQLVTTIFNAFI